MVNTKQTKRTTYVHVSYGHNYIRFRETVHA